MIKRLAPLCGIALILAFGGCKTAPPDRPTDLPMTDAAQPLQDASTKPETPEVEAPEMPEAPSAPHARPLRVAASVSSFLPLAKPSRPGPAVEPVSDSDVLRAKRALARAKEADADYYEPQTYRLAQREYDLAMAFRDEDPDRCRGLLSSAIEAADKAFEASVRKAAVVLQNRIETMDARLRELDADKFMPDDYWATAEGRQEVAELYAEGKGDLLAAREAAYATLKDQTSLHDALSERIRWIEILKRDTNTYLDAAEVAEAHEWAAEELAETNRLYLLGVEAFQSYWLDESEEYFGAAREAARDAARLAQERKAQTEAAQKAEAEELMKKVMASLEAASKLTVVTEEGTVILPEDWSGEEFIEALEEEEDSTDDSSALPIGGRTVVLGDFRDENLLEQAKELWKSGLEEKAKGNYEKAIEYFNQSQKFVEAYRTQAVKAVYTVRLIPDRRDCLWRIAEYDFVYGNPYFWPKIWRRNRKLVQNPDLIQPGWLLIIPPDE